MNVCKMDEATGWCAGCLRTLDEIASWSRLPEAGKQAVWDRLAQRRVLWLQQGRGPLPAPATASAP
jgi:predicted Fe-S protein YdhL (DUF1289 family)